VLRAAGIPFKEENDEPTGAPVAAASPGFTHSLADELAKLARPHESGVLTAEELAAAKAKLPA
jgi:hypothetical protein